MVREMNLKRETEKEREREEEEKKKTYIPSGTGGFACVDGRGVDCGDAGTAKQGERAGD